ncbi:hypothetical protein [Nocardia sp. NPDC004711]
MPIEVDSAERRRRIGEAGVQILRERGNASLTVRAVAEMLGGSTSLVTNFVRNRTELLDLTLETLSAQWNNELDEILGPPEQRLATTVRWALDWHSESAPLVARIMVQILADPTIDLQRLAAVHRELDHLHTVLGDAVDAAEVLEPEAATDLLHLASRGAMLTRVENPDDWPPDRITRAADLLARLLNSMSELDRPSSAS